MAQASRARGYESQGARAQIERLEPLVTDCMRRTSLSIEVESLRMSRDTLRPWFAVAKRTLLDRRLEKLSAEIERLEDRIASLDEKRADRQSDRDEIKRAITDNGGDRIERLKAEVQRKDAELREKQARAQKYEELARAVGLPAAADAAAFPREPNARSSASLRSRTRAPK